MASVQVEQLSKNYDSGRVQAVRSVSFSVAEGELFGLIGPDGAGKTSIFRMLSTLLLPDAGKATVNGFDCVTDYAAIRNCIGYMPGKFSLYQDLSIEENLNFFATLFGTTIAENYELIKDIYIQIEPYKKRRAGKLSGGMKQKLALCCALIHQPKVLFLDEPTTGVDVVSRKEFWDMLQRLKAKGITILVSTPYMDEAMLCDRIGLIQNGSLFTLDTPQAIIQAYPDALFSIRGGNTYQLLKYLRQCPDIKHCYAFGDHLHTSLQEGVEQHPEDWKNYLAAYSTALQVEQVAPTIEDCFIRFALEQTSV